MLFPIPPDVAREIGTCPELTSEEYEQLRAQWGNANDGGLEGPDCPICHNRGYTVTWSQEEGQKCVECQCMPKRRSLARIKRSGLADVLERCTLAGFKADTDWRQAAKQKAVDFLRDDTGAWFAAMGSVGAGKSHLCTAICGELLNAGKEVRYMLWRDEAVRLKGCVNDREDYTRLIEPIKRVQVLCIDDFFKGQKGRDVTPADVNLAFEILNYRYVNRRLVTILSSEKTIEEILDIDEAVGSRIFERCKGHYVKFVGKENWRLRA